MADGEKRVTIKINNAGKPFFYSGVITKEDDHFIWLQDRLEGLLRINKNSIITIKEGDR